MTAQRRLRTDCADAQADLTLRFAHCLFLTCHGVVGSYHFVAVYSKSGCTDEKALSKNVFQLHNWQYKIDAASVYKVSCLYSLIE